MGLGTVTRRTKAELGERSSPGQVLAPSPPTASKGTLRTFFQGDPEMCMLRWLPIYFPFILMYTYHVKLLTIRDRNLWPSKRADEGTFWKVVPVCPSKPCPLSSVWIHTSPTPQCTSDQINVFPMDPSTAPHKPLDLTVQKDPRLSKLRGLWVTTGKESHSVDVLSSNQAMEI